MAQTTQTQTEDKAENLPNDGFTLEEAEALGFGKDGRTAEEIEAAHPGMEW